MRQRKVSSGIFTGKNFQTFFTTVFQEHGEKVVHRIAQGSSGARGADASKSTPVDISSLFYKFTLDSIGRIAFGVDLNTLEKGQVDFADKFDAIQELSLERTTGLMHSIFGQKLLYFGRIEREIRECATVLDDFARGVIEQRRKEDSLDGFNDILSRFMAADRKDGGKSNDAFLRDVVMSFCVAGRDTTAVLLSWMFWLIAKDEAIQAELLKEIDGVLKEAQPNYENTSAKAMPYLNGFIHEVLRLYPPVPVDSKSCVNETVMPDGTVVPATCTVNYDPYAMGRLEELWEDPLNIKPHRWDGVKASQYKFPVFQAGPRICLGQTMALVETRILTCMLLQSFTFQLVDGQDITYKMSVTLAMKSNLGGLHLYASKRQPISQQMKSTSPS